MAEIIRSPGMLSEARQVLHALRVQATTPAGEIGVGRVIAARFQTYPQPVRNQAEWQAFWRDYTEALEDVPEGAIEAAMRAWVKSGSSQFLPKPGELRQLALTTENRDARAYTRARKACEFEPPKTYDNSHVPNIQPRIMRQEPTEADKARIRAWAADFAKQVPDAKAIEFRANYGPTDERGLTEAMREAIKRGQEA